MKSLTRLMTFSKSFQQSQRDMRKLPTAPPEVVISHHSQFPFIKQMLPLALPSLFQIPNLNNAIFSIQQASALSALFDNLCLFTVGIGGAVFACSALSRSNQSFINSSMATLLVSAVPVYLTCIASTFMQNDLSVFSFAIVYPAQVALIYGVQNIQTWDDCIQGIFNFTVISTLGTFTLFLLIMIAVFGIRNQYKAFEMKIEELQKLSNLSTK